jgi:hypothetical protein
VRTGFRDFLKELKEGKQNAYITTQVWEQEGDGRVERLKDGIEEGRRAEGRS